MSSLAGFEAAARLGSFTAAAAALGLTQGAISRQVAQIEARIGQRLFRRTADGLALTEPGRVFLAEILPALATLSRATQRAALRGDALTLSVPASFATFWLLPRLPRFLRSQPALLLNLMTRVGPPDLREGRLDAAILFAAAMPPGCDGCEIMPITLAPVAAATFAGDLATAPLLHQATLPEAWADFLADSGQIRHAPAQGVVLDLLSMGLAAAEAGMGVALLPDFVTREAVAAGRLRRLGGGTIAARGSYRLCWPVGAQTDSLRALSGWLAKETGIAPP